MKDHLKFTIVWNANWSGSEAVTTGRCLACDEKIEQDNYIIYDIKSYIITQEGLLASQTCEINLSRNEIEKLPTKEEIRNQPWSIISLLGVANTIGLIAERYGMKLSGMSIFLDAVHELLQKDANKKTKIRENITGDFLIKKSSVMDEKISALVKAILEKIRDIIRICDYAAISNQATIFILLPESSAEQATVLAERILKEISSLSFSGFFKQTTLSVGISEWQKGFEATDLLQQSKIAMEKAKENSGNQIKIFVNEIASN